jgi:hypothetical protein
MCLNFKPYLKKTVKTPKVKRNLMSVPLKTTIKQKKTKPVSDIIDLKFKASILNAKKLNRSLKR